MTEFRRVERVSGPRSYTISRIGLSFLALFMLSCFATAFTALTRPGQPDGTATAVFFSMLGSIVVAALLMVASVVAFKIQSARERNKGYTWQTDQFQNLDQIDPASYVVIRTAGEEYLSTEARKSRQAEARAWAAHPPVPR